MNTINTIRTQKTEIHNKIVFYLQLRKTAYSTLLSYFFIRSAPLRCYGPALRRRDGRSLLVETGWKSYYYSVVLDIEVRNCQSARKYPYRCGDDIKAAQHTTD